MNRYGVSRIDRVLTFAAAIATASAAVAVLFAVASHGPSGYQPGDKFAMVAGLDPSRSPATVILFINSHCGACQDSVAVLRQIAPTPRTFQTIVIGYEKIETLRLFVDKSSIDADAAISVPEGTINFGLVPTVAILDRLGIVKATWSGAPQINASATQILRAARDVDSAAHRTTGLGDR